MKSAAIRKLNVNGGISSSKEQPPPLEEFYKKIPEDQEFVKVQNQIPNSVQSTPKEVSSENTDKLDTTVVDGKMVAEKNGIIDGADEQMLSGTEDNDKLTDKQGEVKFVKSGDHQNGDAKIDIGGVNGKIEDEWKRRRKAAIEEEKHKRFTKAYKTSLSYISKLNQRDPASLTPREKKLRSYHKHNVKRYENKYGEENAAKSSGANNDGNAAERPTTSNATQISAPQSNVTDNNRANNGHDMAERPKTSRSAQEENQPGRRGASELAVLDRSVNEGRIPEKKWPILEAKIMSALLVEKRRTSNNNIGMFDASHWRNGVKIIKCNNEEAAAFLTCCIRDQGELWQNANFDVVPILELASGPVVRVWIPPSKTKTIKDDEAILARIKRQNPECMPENWKISRSHDCPNGNGKRLWIEIDLQSWHFLLSYKGALKLDGENLNLSLPKKAKEFGSLGPKSLAY